TLIEGLQHPDSDIRVVLNERKEFIVAKNAQLRLRHGGRFINGGVTGKKRVLAESLAGFYHAQSPLSAAGHNATEFDLTGVHHRDLARLLSSPIHKFTGRKHYRACKRGHQILLLGGEPGKNGHLSHTVGFMLMSLWQCQGTHTHNVPGPTESNQLDERQGNAGSAAIPCRYIPKPGANL